LDQVDIGPAIALDQANPLAANGDIPTDDYPIAEGGMGPQDQIKDFVPQGQGPAGDPRPSIGMTGHPSEPGVHPCPGCLAQPAAIKLDGSGETARVHVIDGDIAANRHAQHRTDHLRPFLFVKAADDADGIERSVAEVDDGRMIADSFLNQIGLAQRHPANPFEKLRRGQRLALDVPVEPAAQEIPALGPPPATSPDWFHKQVGLREAVRAADRPDQSAVPCGQQHRNGGKLPLGAIFGKFRLVAQWRRRTSVFGKDAIGAPFGLAARQIGPRAASPARFVQFKDIIPGGQDTRGHGKAKLIAKLTHDRSSGLGCNDGAVPVGEP